MTPHTAATHASPDGFAHAVAQALVSAHRDTASTNADKIVARVQDLLRKDTDDD